MKTLSAYGAGSKAPALDQLVEPRRTATLLAVTRSLEAEAIDDALDLFALLMATRLISPTRRKSAEERLRMLPPLERAAKLVAKAGRSWSTSWTWSIRRTRTWMSRRSGSRWPSGPGPARSRCARRCRWWRS
ncbi:hypothetical protein OG589_12265 [Sphaerisporangium sp. NBC_01403]|uniref:hypothetical protein n=1 Tax=Sphaerisporangium sp. NBC_01403 TaxID=2903599 RepID=UPI00324E06C8